MVMLSGGQRFELIPYFMPKESTGKT